MLQGVSPLNSKFPQVDEIQVLPHPCSKIIKWSMCTFVHVFVCGTPTALEMAKADDGDQTSIIIFISFLALLARCFLPISSLAAFSPSPLSPQILISKFMATGRPYGSPDADGGCPAIALALDQLGTCKYCPTGYR